MPIHVPAQGECANLASCQYTRIFCEAGALYLSCYAVVGLSSWDRGPVNLRERGRVAIWGCGPRDHVDDEGRFASVGGPRRS